MKYRHIFMLRFHKIVIENTPKLITNYQRGQQNDLADDYDTWKMEVPGTELIGPSALSAATQF